MDGQYCVESHKKAGAEEDTGDDEHDGAEKHVEPHSVNADRGAAPEEDEVAHMDEVGEDM